MPPITARFKALLNKLCACASAIGRFTDRYMHQGVLAAFIVAGLIAMFAGIISKGLISPHELDKDAVTIEAVEVVAGGAVGPTGPEPILGLLATADVEKGKSLAKACAACHSFDKGGPNGVGPNLWGTINNKKQHAAGFAYSGALVEHGGPTWTLAEMNKFIYKPKVYAPGTKMSFAGLKKPDDRAAVIAYLRTLADSPAALPAQGEIDAEIAELAPPVAEGADPAKESETASEGDAGATGSATADKKDAAAPATTTLDKTKPATEAAKAGLDNDAKTDVGTKEEDAGKAASDHAADKPADTAVDKAQERDPPAAR